MGIEGPRSPQDALRVTSGLPSLVLSGQYDPITPPKYAAQVAASLSNSYYFDFRATGHGAAYGRTDCAMELITAFLDQPAQSPDGACVAAIPPVDFELPDTLVPGATPTAAPPPLPPSGSIIAPDTGSGPAEQRGTRGVAAWIAIGGAVVLMLGVARWRLVAR
jgi:hypothetical protein